MTTQFEQLKEKSTINFFSFSTLPSGSSSSFSFSSTTKLSSVGWYNLMFHISYLALIDISTYVSSKVLEPSVGTGVDSFGVEHAGNMSICISKSCCIG